MIQVIKIVDPLRLTCCERRLMDISGYLTIKQTKPLRYFSFSIFPRTGFWNSTLCSTVQYIRSMKCCFINHLENLYMHLLRFNSKRFQISLCKHNECNVLFISIQIFKHYFLESHCFYTSVEKLPHKFLHRYSNYAFLHISRCPHSLAALRRYAWSSFLKEKKSNFFLSQGQFNYRSIFIHSRSLFLYNVLLG